MISTMGKMRLVSESSCRLSTSTVLTETMRNHFFIRTSEFALRSSFLAFKISKVKIFHKR